MKLDYQFVDVFGMDPDLLAMVPQPCRAMLLLFPINDKVGPMSLAISVILSSHHCRLLHMKRKLRRESRKMDRYIWYCECCKV